MSSASRHFYEHDDLVFAEFFKAMRRRWLLIASLVVGGVVAAVMFSKLVTPKYEAETVLMAVDDSGLSSVLGGMSPALTGIIGAVGGGLNSRSMEREAIAVLESRAFAVDFIAREQALPIIFPELWDAQNKAWRTKDRKAPSMNSAFQRFHREIRKVRKNSEAGEITLSIRLADRSMAAEWANKLVAQLNDDLRNRVIAESQGSLAFLASELERTEVIGVRDSIFRLVEAQTKEIMLAKVRQQYALRVIDPAVPADEGNFAYPKVVILAALGGLAGLLLGVLLAVFWRRDLPFGQGARESNA